ncbi:MAG: hypothetical protein O2894_03185 [Planctomycetota bacterium]|nr:hypothetical protein [Planctomycetota bacterium]
MSHPPVPTEPIFNPEDPEVPVPVRGTGDHGTWFTRHVRGIIIGLYVTAFVVLMLDLFYAKHSYFSEEDWFGFYGFYGFVGCVTLVLLAKLLRKAVMRSEDYWDA